MLEDNLRKHDIFLNADIIYYGEKDRPYLVLLKCNWALDPLNWFSCPRWL